MKVARVVLTITVLRCKDSKFASPFLENIENTKILQNVATAPCIPQHERVSDTFAYLSAPLPASDAVLHKLTKLFQELKSRNVVAVPSAFF